MLVRSTITQGLPQCCVKRSPYARRGIAAAATVNPFHFSVGDAAGIKVASRDDGGPTTSLAIVVRGGSRYQSGPGLAHGLTNFAFKNTTKRSALRLQREVELLGGSVSSNLSRENIVLKAKFLRNDLPYFAEAIGDVLGKTKYISYEFNEEVAPIMALNLDSFVHKPAAIALEHAHHVAFHSGLGNHRLAMSNKVPPSLIASYARQVYQRSNIAVIASGATQNELEKWTSEFFTDITAGNGVASPPTKYFGGENRTYSSTGDAIVIAFPGSESGPSFKAEWSVIAYILGGGSSTKWNTGTSAISQAIAQLPGVKAVAQHVAYSDAGLLTISITGPQQLLARAGEEVVKTINGIANVKPEDVKKAIAQAKFDVLAAAEDRSAGLELVGQSVIASGKAAQAEDVVKALEAVTADTVKSAAKTILEGRATYTTVGDLNYLPFASDIGLRV